MPTFKGGDEAFKEFLKSELKYPEEAKATGVAGMVIVRFTVEKDGKLSDFEILESPDELLSQEALRVIKKMPDWNPGMKDGEPVNVQFVMPVQFTGE